MDAGKDLINSSPTFKCINIAAVINPEIKKAEKVSFIGMGNKFEVWNDQNWEMRQTGGALSTEILEVVLPESLKTISF